MISQRPPTVWIDDSHAIVRPGMAGGPQPAHFVLRGGRALLAPDPAVADPDILVFEYAGATLRRAVRLAEGRDTRLVATVREVNQQAVREIVDAGVSAVLPHGTLTADALVTSLRSVVAGNVALPGDMLA